MIPPVRTDPVWGRAQSGPPTGSVGLEGLGQDQSKQHNIYQFQIRSEKLEK